MWKPGRGPVFVWSVRARTRSPVRAVSLQQAPASRLEPTEKHCDLSGMADDQVRTYATNYIDGEFRRVQDDLIHEHRRQEQRMLSWEKAALESHARNREVAELRYVQRLKAIE